LPHNEEIDNGRRAFLARMKTTALWAAPVITAITVMPRKASAEPFGEGS
jgi:hypothetical protein